MEFQYLISKSEKMMEGDGFMVALWSFLNLASLSPKKAGEKSCRVSIRVLHVKAYSTALIAP